MSDRSEYHYGPPQAGPSSAPKSPALPASLSSSHSQASSKYSPSHGPVRLPRLQFMDQDVPRRNRSVSSASQTGYGSGFGPWSPSSPDRHSAISGGGSSSHGGDAGPGMHSPPQAQRSFSHHHHPQGSRSPIFPNLPTPSRRSTMMDGSLPPLSILHGERDREAPWQNSGRMSAGPGSAGARHHHTPYQQPSAPSRSSAYPPYASGQYSDGPPPPPPPPPPPHAPLPTESRGLATAAPTSTSSTGSLAAGSSGPNEANPASASERKTAKAHVSSACLNCKRAHLACDAERPCRRCTKLGKTATCVDVQHKKRGRPRLKDRESMSMSELSPSSATYGPTGGAPWQPHHEGAHGYPPPVMSAVAHGPASASNLNATARGRSFSATSAVTSSSGTSRYPLASPASVATSLDSGPSPIVTMLCGTDIVAAQISSEAQIIFGLHPSQLHHRSVLELVHPDDVPRFETCWSKLVEPVGIEPSAFPSIGRDIMRNHHCPLLAPARGTIFIEEAVRMRTAGNKPWSTCSIRTHLGGAFGLDLYRPETKDRAYVVCSIAVGPEGNQHPDMTALRSKEFPPGPWPNVAFSTPMPETSQRSLLAGRPRAPTVGEVPSYGRPSGRDWGARYHEHAMPPGPPRDGEQSWERAGRKRSFGEVERDDNQRGEEQLQQRRGSGASALFVAEKMRKSTSPTQDARPIVHKSMNGAHESTKARDESASPPAARESKENEAKPLTPPDHIRHPFSSYPHTASGARFQPYSIPRAASGSTAKGNGAGNGTNSNGDHFRWPSASSTSSSSSLSSSSVPSSTPRFLSSTARSTMMEAPSSSSSSSHNVKRPNTSSVVDNNPLRRGSAGPPKPASPVAAAGRTSVSSARGGRVGAGELGFVAC